MKKGDTKLEIGQTLLRMNFPNAVFCKTPRCTTRSGNNFSYWYNKVDTIFIQGSNYCGPVVLVELYKLVLSGMELVENEVLSDPNIRFVVLRMICKGMIKFGDF